MTYTITNQCIACDRCLSACPTDAIQREAHHYWINTDLCNSCTGHYSVPQCWATCPTTGACVPFLAGVTAVATSTAPSLNSTDPTDYWEHWFATYERLVARLKAMKQADYWEQWFEIYAQELSKLMQAHKTKTVGVEA